MRASAIASMLALAASGVNAGYYNNQSAPFYLVLTSQNATINGSRLAACHSGAAFENLCLAPANSTGISYEYNFNYSSTGAPGSPTGVNLTGLLTWWLPVTSENGAENISSPMTFDTSFTSNVAVPQLFPGDTGTFISFDDDDKMAILSYQDDTQPLPNFVQKPFYNWYACTTYTGYLYHTLAWVIGKGEPQNPTCQKVEVTRVFVDS